MLGGLPGSTLVANWFIRGRGMALGIATVGISMSGLIMAPVATQLIAGIGWQETFVIYALIVVVVILPAVWLVIVNRPEDMGLRPDGLAPGDPIVPEDAPEPVLPLAAGDQMTDHAAHLDWSALGTLKDANFWMITLAIGLNFCANGAILTHIIPHATDLGYTPTRAAFVLSACAGMGVVGKILFGWITDRVDKRLALWLAVGLQASGVALIIGATDYSALLMAGGVFGLGMGGLVPIWGTLVGSAFGRHAFGRVMGLMSPCMLPVMSFGVPFAGYVFDRTGNYDVAFRTFLFIYAASAMMLVFLRLPEVEPGHEPAA